MPGDPRGAAMMQAFQGLMQDPTAMKAMMAGAQQMGLPPEMLQQLMGGMGGGGEQQMPMNPMEGGGQPMPPEAEVEGEGGMPPETYEGEGAEPVDPEQMAMDEIDRAGNTWDGVDAPTQNDIERLRSAPTDSAVESFDAQFGDGAAAKYMESTENDQPEAEGEEEY